MADPGRRRGPRFVCESKASAQRLEGLERRGAVGNERHPWGRVCAHERVHWGEQDI
jgi:hypothetical protein